MQAFSVPAHLSSNRKRANALSATSAGGGVTEGAVLAVEAPVGGPPTGPRPPVREDAPAGGGTQLGGPVGGAKGSTGIMELVTVFEGNSSVLVVLYGFLGVGGGLQESLGQLKPKKRFRQKHPCAALQVLP